MNDTIHTSLQHTRNVEFAGSQDELLEIVERWSLILPGKREDPPADNEEDFTLKAWMLRQLADGRRLWLSAPAVKRTSLGTLVRIDLQVGVFVRRWEIDQLRAAFEWRDMPAPGDYWWRVDPTGEVSLTIPKMGVVAIAYPAELGAECADLVAQIAEYRRDQEAAEEAQTAETTPAWYQQLTAEERRRHDLLAPYRQKWIDGEVTDADIANEATVDVDTIRRWRRGLRKRGAPDMDWNGERKAKGTGYA